MGSPRRDRREGQALILATMSLFVLFGAMGLAVDLGWSYYRKQVAQTAVDSAALAAAVVAENSAFGGLIACGLNGTVCQAASACPAISGSPANNIQSGCLYAKANGFVNGGNQTVTMASSSPGLFVDPAKFAVLYTVTATASEASPQLFSRFFGNDSSTVQAQATAQVVQLPAQGCIFALNTSIFAGAFQASAGANVQVNGCGIYVNSTNILNGLSASGGATVQAGFIDIAGGYQILGGSLLSPAPVTGISPVADPLILIPPPPPPVACDYTNFNIGGQTSQTVGPGTYCGGINVSGRADIVFNPGTYYIYGGGINLSTSGSVTGSGVVFFNSEGHGILGLPTCNFAPVTVAGSGPINLSAPTSGSYSGVLFYKDRLVSSNESTDTFSAQTKATLTGSLYFPGDNLVLSSPNGIALSICANASAIVADTIAISGGVTVSLCGANSTQNRFAALVQ